MGIFSGWFGKSVSADVSSSRDPGADFWYGPVKAPVAAGVAVSVETAITVPVVYDCLKVLSDTIGTLPFGMFQRVGDGSKRREDRHPLMAVFRDPGDNRTSVEFFQQMVWDLATEGNAYFEIRSGARGFADSLLRMEPSSVTVERLSDRSVRYKFREAGRPERILSDEAVWHIAVTPLISGLVGRSPIDAGREAIGAAIALQDYGARYFQNDATPPYVLKHPSNFKDAESRKNYLKAIKRWWGGENRHSPGLLEHGVEPEKLGVTNEASQFLETRKELAIEITRLWHMPPHKVGILDRATFSNIEQQSLEFVIDTLLPWIRLIEKSIEKHLILNPDRFLFEFNVAGLLRGDIKTRFEAYAVGRNWGWLSVNEIRALENLNPIPNGNEYLQPLNMTRAGTPSDPNDPPKANGKLPNGQTVGGHDQVVNGHDQTSLN